MSVLLAAPDKFRGSATADEVAAAIALGAEGAGWTVRCRPLADGGEGFLDAFTGAAWHRREATVTGPGGGPVRAAWAHTDGVAVVEAARASGLALVGGRSGNDPWAATSTGTGELVARAVATVGPGGTVLVGIGGTACTDGGWGAAEAIWAAGGLRGSILVGAVDVAVPFLEAARRFGPQKGATPAQIDGLTSRLAEVAERYRRSSGVDVREVAGTGAGGGLGGAVVALGGRLRPGFEVVDEQVGFEAALDGADLVVTGEGRLDETSFTGKVVGAVLDRCAARDRPVAVAVVVGRSTPDGRRRAEARGARVVDLSAEMGAVRARTEVASCVAEAVATLVTPPGGERAGPR